MKSLRVVQCFGSMLILVSVETGIRLITLIQGSIFTLFREEHDICNFL
jgi:hypothetical protein